MRCAVCGKRVVAKDYSGRPLCEEHFLQSVVERAEKELEGVNSKILLAVSGGKDSLVLMDVVAQLRDPKDLVAATVVEGAPGGYRVKEAQVAKRFAEKLGIKHITITFKELFGKSLEEMVAKGKLSPCTYCGVFRRRALEVLARRLGAVVATGHTLDDEAHTALLNLLRGSWDDLLRLNAKSRIKPLRKVYEREVSIYAYIKKFPFQSEECPYIVRRPSLRGRLREELFEYERERPGTLFKWRERFEGLGEPKRRFKLCERCGFPTSPNRRVCKVCELAEEVGASVPRLEEHLQVGLLDDLGVRE
ncbi:TIGR00269 family protein [Ignicoccus hospitalis]|uniref:PP-loop domain protein n=1 Tax=Ignicoccus hospitalis (strain KIN4/I / DSM 18386 / JCM 14125) TaxID=453591 RepID=A8A9T7_IGNH4|nr:TIGR00269 family protein [Ignicoccus hospitalis]ABU81689.1 PP-loop domain protein [Ignicoccus hospitalis KIN4/I]HIH89806.1 TIGR00269 family protein [Desulfurococcaceae archaeon]